MSVKLLGLQDAAAFANQTGGFYSSCSGRLKLKGLTHDGGEGGGPCSTSASSHHHGPYSVAFKMWSALQDQGDWG